MEINNRGWRILPRVKSTPFEEVADPKKGVAKGNSGGFGRECEKCLERGHPVYLKALMSGVRNTVIFYDAPSYPYRSLTSEKYFVFPALMGVITKETRNRYSPNIISCPPPTFQQVEIR